MDTEQKNTATFGPDSVPGEDKVAEAARAGRETSRLRLYFLMPLTAVILATIAVSVVDLYRHGYADIQQGVVHVRTSATKLHENSVRDSARALRTLMQVIGRDETLRAALARKDRAALLARAAPMFADMKDDYGVTHFYFTAPDRVNLLRVHKPDRHGDTIGRFTTLAAERNATTAYGVELGPLGLFTLRLVTPWYDEKTRRLLGYVELGMEIDHVIEHLRAILGVNVFVLIDKHYLTRPDWEQGMRALGRTPDWGRFPAMVASLHDQQTIPTALAERLARQAFGTEPSILSLVRSGVSQRAVFLPLQDAGGRDVARLVLLVDISDQVDTAQHMVTIGVATTLIAGASLFALFWWLVGRIGRRIERDEQTLHDLATHDQLTGAWNRRWFDELLTRETTRARRYGSPLSLIMFDIDHFKQVNDTYGHQAGDDLLAVLSVYVSVNIRDTDMLARWGGEEFMVIAPNIGVEAAGRLAQKLRVLIEGGDFGEVGRITCSFGVTQFRTGDTAEDFTGRADAAMYTAKQAGRNRVECYKSPPAG